MGNKINLDNKQQLVVNISAFTEVGNMDSLTIELSRGLEAGLTINKIKEILVHLYAYTGFPRSLNALAAFMQVIEEAKKQGKEYIEGENTSPLPENTDILKLGTQVQTELVGQPVSGGVMEFSPAIDRYLKTHLFGDIFAGDVLTYQQRELVTVSALAAMTGLESQLQSHLVIAMNTGLTENQLLEVMDQIEQNINKEQADIGRKILSKLKEYK
ncbi:carboxymuconolactone decarboxylase family protein [Apibacter muscae]|uniref:Carboxymuconolactone decarboxylase family protein n=1 Tax=Apibacter muscae TaxID=2509004 RepID=A0A563D7R8_9FLAO|nr:carboxymuconolactone decarboxylase family protein [Apibacter muscae]TWP26245.1 carboxymuconolactone decarboxylase family protein [Apibacter muscae]